MWKLILMSHFFLILDVAVAAAVDSIKEFQFDLECKKYVKRTYKCTPYSKYPCRHESVIMLNQ